MGLNMLNSKLLEEIDEKETNPKVSKDDNAEKIEVPPEQDSKLPSKDITPEYFYKKFGKGKQSALNMMAYKNLLGGKIVGEYKTYGIKDADFVIAYVKLGDKMFSQDFGIRQAVANYINGRVNFLKGK